MGNTEGEKQYSSMEAFRLKFLPQAAASVKFPVYDPQAEGTYLAKQALMELRDKK